MTNVSLREHFVQSRGIKVLYLLALSSSIAISQSPAQISLRVGVVALAGLGNSTLV